MRQSACLDCNHTQPGLDQEFCPSCQGGNMTSNKYQVIMAHAKRLKAEKTEGTKEFNEAQRKALQELAAKADLEADRKALQELAAKADIEADRRRTRGRPPLREVYQIDVNLKRATPTPENFGALNANN